MTDKKKYEGRVIKSQSGFFDVDLSPHPDLPPKGEGIVLSPSGGERREGAK